VWTLGDVIPKGILFAALTGLAACQAADGTTVAPDTALVNSLMAGIGAVDPNKKEIDYKPRAPLAMPADGSVLPEPETAVAGTSSENWPKQSNNAEINALRARYESKRDHNGDLKRLTPEQMAGFEIAGAERRELTAEEILAQEPEQDLGPGKRLSPEQMKASTQAYRDLQTLQSGDGSATAALERKYLIEPPSSYSTPSADAPMPSTDVKVKKSVAEVQRDHSTNRLDPRCMSGETKYCN